MTRALRALALALTFAACLPAPHGHGAGSRVTYYVESGFTASGEWTHDGGAACPRAYMGVTLHIVEPDVYVTCNDTGAAYWFETGDLRVDVWSPYGRPAWMTGDWYDVEVGW